MVQQRASSLNGNTQSNNHSNHEVVVFEAQPLVKQILDAVPDILLILNQDRRIVYSNNSLLLLTNLPIDDVLGQRLGDLLQCAHAIDSDEGCGTTIFCRTCGAFRAMTSSLNGEMTEDECRIAQAGGDALDLRVWATPLDIDGVIYCAFAVNDISSEKRQRALERVFFHDVLNTAGVLSTYTKMIELGDSDDLLPKLGSIVDRLIGEINAQKDLLAAESRELTPIPQLLAPKQVLQGLIEQYRYFDGMQSVELELLPCVDDMHFVSDPTLLARVLGNMIKNAVEASGDGDIVTISCETNDEHITFSVHNPAYMPRDIQLQVFKRSFSTKGSGRGLGTYSMKLLTERYLFGEVSFSSTKESGTIFYACFPLEWQGKWID